jgi:hypothetical protein
MSEYYGRINVSNLEEEYLPIAIGKIAEKQKARKMFLENYQMCACLKMILN